MYVQYFSDRFKARWLALELNVICFYVLRTIAVFHVCAIRLVYISKLTSDKLEFEQNTGKKCTLYFGDFICKNSYDYSLCTAKSEIFGNINVLQRCFNDTECNSDVTVFRSRERGVQHECKTVLLMSTSVSTLHRMLQINKVT